MASVSAAPPSSKQANPMVCDPTPPDSAAPSQRGRRKEGRKASMDRKEVVSVVTQKTPAPIGRETVEEKMRELLQMTDANDVPLPQTTVAAPNLATDKDQRKPATQSAHQVSRSFLQAVLTKEGTSTRLWTRTAPRSWHRPRSPP